MLKREVPAVEKTTTTTEAPQPRVRSRTNKKANDEEEPIRTSNKFRVKVKSKIEGKGVIKERNDSGSYSNRRVSKNKIKVREDLSEDISE